VTPPGIYAGSTTLLVVDIESGTPHRKIFATRTAQNSPGRFRDAAIERQISKNFRFYWLNLHHMEAATLAHPMQFYFDIIRRDVMQRKKKKLYALMFAGSFAIAVGAAIPVAFAQMAPSAVAAPGTTDPGTAAGNNSGGTAPGPVYGGPAAASGANSPPVNSGITDPKTGANNDTRPMNSTTSGPTMPAGPNSAANPPQ
jgi:hypothetical protein